MTLQEKINKGKKMVIHAMDVLDSTGWNSNYYKKKFNDMSDEEFVSFCKTGIVRMYVEYDVNDASLENGIKLCEEYGVSPMEYVTLPFLYIDDETGEELISDKKCLVIDIKVKRLHQIITKENSSSSTISERDAKTNQASGDSKSAMLSDTEVAMMVARGYKKTITEMMTVRADHTGSKEEFYTSIRQTGKASLPDSINRPENKTVVPMLHFYYLGAGLLTDLIEDDVERYNESYGDMFKPMLYSEFFDFFKKNSEKDIEKSVFLPITTKLFDNQDNILASIAAYIESVVKDDSNKSDEFNSKTLVSSNMYKKDDIVMLAATMEVSSFNENAAVKNDKTRAGLCNINNTIVTILYKNDKVLEIYLMFKNTNTSDDSPVINYMIITKDVMEVAKSMKKE